MEDGRIADADISATDHHVSSSAARFARLNNQEGAGAWCHSSIDKNDENEFLEVRDFQGYSKVTGSSIYSVTLSFFYDPIRKCSKFHASRVWLSLVAHKVILYPRWN